MINVASVFITFITKVTLNLQYIKNNQYFIIAMYTQCARTDLNKRFLPKPMTTTG